MTCQHAEPQLNALADCALNPWQAARVRRHLAACPACAADFAAIRRLDASARAWQDTPAPAALQARIAAALPPGVSMTRRLPSVLLVVRHAAFVVLCLAVTGGSWLVVKSLSQPTLAYADVESAMQQVQTVSWVETMEFYNPQGHLAARATQKSTHWLRTSPPALAVLDGTQDLADAEGERVRLAPGVYADFGLNKLGRGLGIAETVHAALRELTEPQVSTGYMGYGGTPCAAFKFSPVTQQSVIYQGQTRILFVRDQEIVAQRKHGPPNRYLNRISLWADPKTQRVVRIETRDLSGFAQGSGWVITRSDFRYNQPPPPGVFDWSIPVGAKVKRGMAGFDALLYFARLRMNKSALPLK